MIKKKKICKICKVEKDIEEYYIQKNGYILLRCKPCHRSKYSHSPAYYKEWLAKHPDYHKKYHIQRYKTDKPIVYAIYTPDKKLYIGQTSLDMMKRFGCHANNIGCSLYEHMKTAAYKFDDLKYKILCEVRTKKEAKKIESAIIKAMKLAVPNQIINIYN